MKLGNTKEFKAYLFTTKKFSSKDQSKTYTVCTIGIIDDNDVNLVKIMNQDEIYDELSQHDMFTELKVNAIKTYNLDKTVRYILQDIEVV